MLPDDFKANGQAKERNARAQNTEKGAAHDSAQETPGLMQLVICVLGIYASLYVHRSNGWH